MPMTVLTPFILIIFGGLEKKNWVESWSFRKTARKGDKWSWPSVIPEMWEAALSVSAVPNVSVNELTAVCMAHRCVGFLGQVTVSWRWM